MTRLATTLLAVLAAVAATAAPAPLPRPWVSGWDRPVDPKGDCKFERDGDRLAITVPGRSHQFDEEEGRLDAPRLLRDVEGDFVVQVRVGGAFRPTGREGYHQAGLLLTDGKNLFLLGRGAVSEDSLLGRARYGGEGPLPLKGFFGRGLHVSWADGPPLDRPAYFRLERRGNSLRAAVSEDGRRWTRFNRPLPGVKLPRKVKVGVFAESTAPGKFRVRFDRFTLSRPRQ